MRVCEKLTTTTATRFTQLPPYCLPTYQPILAESVLQMLRRAKIALTALDGGGIDSDRAAAMRAAAAAALDRAEARATAVARAKASAGAAGRPVPGRATNRQAESRSQQYYF